MTDGDVQFLLESPTGIILPGSAKRLEGTSLRSCWLSVDSSTHNRQRDLLLYYYYYYYYYYISSSFSCVGADLLTSNIAPRYNDILIMH